MIYIAATALDSKDYPPADSLPDGLDPQQHRIIATHFFGWQRLDAVAARVVQRIPPPEGEP